MALTDLGNLFGLVKFYTGARGKGVKPIAAYCLAQFSDSHIQPFLCREADIARAKASSKSFERGNGPWKTDEAAMVAKTAVRRFAKYLPETPLMVKAHEYDEPEVTITATETVPKLPAGGLREALTALERREVTALGADRAEAIDVRVDIDPGMAPELVSSHVERPDAPETPHFAAEPFRDDAREDGEQE